MFIKNKVVINLIVFNLVFVVTNCIETNVDVKTTSGVVRGQTIQVLNTTINEFLGIPYAEPPVGKLRFAKPEPIKTPIKVSYYNNI